MKCCHSLTCFLTAEERTERGWLLFNLYLIQSRTTRSCTLPGTVLIITTVSPWISNFSHWRLANSRYRWLICGVKRCSVLFTLLDLHLERFASIGLTECGFWDEFFFSCNLDKSLALFYDGGTLVFNNVFIYLWINLFIRLFIYAHFPCSLSGCSYKI